MVENPPRRVLMKSSGEVLGGGSTGLGPNVVLDIAHQVAAAVNDRVQITIVVDGGNFFRGAELSQRGLDRARADYMGVLGTVMSTLALRGFLEQAGVRTHVQSATTMTQVAEPYVLLRAIRHLRRGRVVVFSAGARVPYFSANTISTQCVLETHYQELLVSKNGVDGAYTADPHKGTNTTKLDRVSYEQALHNGPKMVDATASALCKDNGLAMQVFGMGTPGNVTKVLLGEDTGTVLYNENGTS